MLFRDHPFDRGLGLAAPRLGQADFFGFLTTGIKAYTDIRAAEATEEAAEQARKAAEAQARAAEAAAAAIAMQTAAQQQQAAQDIIPGVPNWLLLLGGVGAVVAIGAAVVS